MSVSKNEGGARGDSARTSTSEDLFAENEDGPLDFSWVDLPGLLFFWLLAIIVFLQFFTRYVLNDSLAWTEEIGRYVLILVAFAGAITVVRKGTSIFLEFFYRYIPALWGKWLSIFAEIISASFYGYLVILGVDLSMRTRTKMASADIPKNLVYWSVTICLAVMAIYSLYWVVKKIRQTPEEVRRDIEDHAMAE